MPTPEWSLSPSVIMDVEGAALQDQAVVYDTNPHIKFKSNPSTLERLKQKQTEENIIFIWSKETMCGTMLPEYTS